MKSSQYKRTPGAQFAGLICAALLSTASSTWAYTWGTCDDGSDWIRWQGDEGAACDGCVKMAISTTSFPIGGAFDQDLMAAMSSWNGVERSSANFTYERDTSGSYEIINGRNEIVFDDVDGASGTLAFARLRYNGIGVECVPFDDSNISEADVVFDSAESWYTGSFSYTSTRISFRAVAVHELGHVLGLKHENDVMARMNSYYPNSGPITRGRSLRPISDDRNGIRHLYAEAGTAKADLVASNFRRTGVGTSAKVNTLPTSVARGGSVTLQFTMMNIGSANADSFSIGFYLSTDDNITTTDRLLGTNSAASLAAGASLTSSRTLTIPATVTPGTYYVGVLLDKNGSVPEWSETDNGLPYWRTIRVY